MDIRPTNVTLEVTFMREGSTFKLSLTYPSDTSPFALIDESELLAVAISAVKEEGLGPVPPQSIHIRKGEGWFPIVCSECGKHDVTTFKPKANKPILCQACYNQKKGL